MSPRFKLKNCVYAAAFSPDGALLAYIARYRVVLQHIATGEIIWNVRALAHPSHVDFSPLGDFVAVRSTSGQIVILSAKTGALIHHHKNRGESEGDEIRFSHCGRYLIYTTWNGHLTVRECNTGRMVHSQKFAPNQLRELSTTSDRSIFAFAILFQPGSETEAPPPDAIQLHRWPFADHKPTIIPCRWAFTASIALSPSGRYLAIVHGVPPNTLELFDLIESTTIATARRPSGGCGADIAWSPCEQLITVVADNEFRTYSIPDLVLLSVIPSDYACHPRYSPDGQLLVLGSWNASRIVPSACPPAKPSSSKPTRNSPSAPPAH